MKLTMRNDYQITCIVDNSVLEGSGLLNEHGLSMLIETPHGEVLFDTGKTEKTLSHNMQMLKIAPQDISTIALSHSHVDHIGGVNLILRQGKHPRIYANPDLFMQHYAYRNNEYRCIGTGLTQNELTNDADLQLSTSPIEIVPGLWTSGFIENRHEPQGRNDDHVVQQGDSWIPDPYLDDMSLILETSTGLALICGCCHAGILNTLFHVEKVFQKNVTMVFGGIHLVSATEATTYYVIEKLGEMFPNLVYYLNHCTGEYAYEKMSQAFTSRIFRFPAGTRVQLS